MSLVTGHEELAAAEGIGPAGVTVLLVETDWATRASLKAALEKLAVRVIPAPSVGRALALCNTPYVGFDVLVVGPSLRAPDLGGFVERVLSAQQALRLVALTTGSLDATGDSRMRPLAVCWILEGVGCEYALLEEPWTGPRLHLCLQELLERSCDPAAETHAAKATAGTELALDAPRCPADYRVGG